MTDGFRQPSSPPVQERKKNSTCTHVVLPTMLVLPGCGAKTLGSGSSLSHLDSHQEVWLALGKVRAVTPQLLVLLCRVLSRRPPILAFGIGCLCVHRDREGDKRLKAPLQNKTLLFGPWSLSGNGLWSHRTRKGLIADKIVSVFEELVVFTGLKIFTAQSKRRPRGEGNVSLDIKILASPMEARTVGMQATHYLRGCRTVAARWGPRK